MARRTAEQEQARLLALSVRERRYWEQGLLVAGADEVGRGPLAGPVVAAAVLLPPGCLIEGVDDSKKLSERKREQLYERIREKAVAYGVGWVGPERIDEINILQATREAFGLAYEAMEVKPDILLVDAVKGLAIPVRQEAVVHGDALCYAIGAASILAKVERDRYMRQQAALYPGYGFETHKGYGTAAHMAAIRQLGPCPLHRRSFIRKVWGE